MAVIRDMMPAFELFQPASIDEALSLLDQHKAEAWVMGGGMDSFDWLKDRTKRPNVVVDLSQVAELRGIKEVNGGLEIGATTTSVGSGISTLPDCERASSARASANGSGPSATGVPTASRKSPRASKIWKLSKRASATYTCPNRSTAIPLGCEK